MQPQTLKTHRAEAGGASCTIFHGVLKMPSNDNGFNVIPVIPEEFNSPNSEVMAAASIAIITLLAEDVPTEYSEEDMAILLTSAIHIAHGTGKTREEVKKSLISCCDSVYDNLDSLKASGVFNG